MCHTRTWYFSCFTQHLDKLMNISGNVANLIETWRLSIISSSMMNRDVNCCETRVTHSMKLICETGIILDRRILVPFLCVSRWELLLRDFKAVSIEVPKLSDVFCDVTAKI